MNIIYMRSLIAIIVIIIWYYKSFSKYLIIFVIKVENSEIKPENFKMTLPQ